MIRGRDGRYEPIRTNPENDTLQIHTDRELPQGENSKLSIRRSNRNVIKPNRYGSVPYQGNFCMLLTCYCYKTIMELHKKYSTTAVEIGAEATRHSPGPSSQI